MSRYTPIAGIHLLCGNIYDPSHGRDNLGGRLWYETYYVRCQVDDIEQWRGLRTVIGWSKIA